MLRWLEAYLRLSTIQGPVRSQCSERGRKLSFVTLEPYYTSPLISRKFVACLRTSQLYTFGECFFTNITFSPMARRITVAAAQVGAVHIDADKKQTVQRLIKLLHEAVQKKVQLVVFPECTLTTFFPRHLFQSQEELDRYFEHGEDITQSPDVKPLFDEAKSHGVDIVLGYGERTTDGTGFNTCVYFSASQGTVISKYRKVHLPGTKEPFEDPKAINQLEKRYFTPGNLGFPAFRAPGLVPDAIKKSTTKEGDSTVGKGYPIFGMLICNDRRWPEAWRMYSLKGAELIMFGFNTGGESCRFEPHLKKQ